VTTDISEIRSTLDALKKSRSVLQREIAPLLERRDLTGAQEKSFNHKMAEIARVQAEITDLEVDYRSELERGVRAGTFHTESGDGATGIDGPRQVSRGPSRMHRHYDDPWDFRASPLGDDVTEVRDRALSIIDESRSRGFEQMPVADEDRARVDKLLRNDRYGDLA
jgi:hypothetical protein